MVSHHVFSQLVLFALIWLVVIWHLTQSKRPVTTPTAPALPEPLQPKRSRSNEPKPFEGLTHKPHCALCERDTTSPQSPPPVPPDSMAPPHRRPREVDTSMYFCPHAGCDYRGWLGLGNLRANGHPSGGPWRQFQCTACDSYFLETHGTLFHGKQAAVGHCQLNAKNCTSVQSREDYMWVCAFLNPCIFATHRPSDFLKGKASGRDFQ